MAFVTFEDVGKVYKSGDVAVRALHDVSFEIERGEICVVVGQSGAGKTTPPQYSGRYGHADGGSRAAGRKGHF